MAQDSEAPTSPVRSLLKWAGGKSRISPSIALILSQIHMHDKGVFIDPFVGGASIPALLNLKHGVCSDTNVSLISFYKWLVVDYKLLYQMILAHSTKMTKTYYYHLRSKFLISDTSLQNAAAFYALNRYSFNGIFRTNKSGQFNVPYNYKKRTSLPSESDFAHHAEALKNITFKAQDYRLALCKAKRGDLVYLDPPYPALSSTAFFNHYSPECFSQEDLAKTCSELDKIGCNWVMSNASTPLTRKLYKDHQKISLKQTRFVSCKKVKMVAKELLVFGRHVSVPVNLGDLQ